MDHCTATGILSQVNIRLFYDIRLNISFQMLYRIVAPFCFCIMSVAEINFKGFHFNIIFLTSMYDLLVLSWMDVTVLVLLHVCTNFYFGHSAFRGR